MGFDIDLPDIDSVIAQAMQSQQTRSVTLSPDMIARVVNIDGKHYYVDVTRSIVDDSWIYVLIDADGNVSFGKAYGTVAGKRAIARFENMSPPRSVPVFEVFSSVEPVTIGDLFAKLENMLRDIIVFHKPELYTFLASYIMYSWVHSFSDKKPFLFVTGMFGTGKSIVSSVVRRLGRNAFDLLTTMTSSAVWVAGLTKGVAIIDETDRLSQTFRMVLRRMHDEGMNIVKMMADAWGWNMMVLDISVPVVFSGTHLPRDPALLSRGIVIKMHYGKQKVKMVSIKDDMELMKHVVAKSMLVRWKRFIDAYNEAFDLLSNENIHERYIDIIAPLIAIHRLSGVDYSYIFDVVADSATNAMYTSPVNLAIFAVVRALENNFPVVNNLVCVNEKELAGILNDVKDRYGLNDSDFNYVAQYFISAGEPADVDGDFGYCFALSDVRAVSKMYMGRVIKVDRKRGTVKFEKFGARK